MAIEIKGITIPALLINLDSLTSIEDNLRDIELKMSSSFFSNSKVVINTNGLDLTDGDRGRLHEMLREHGALIVDVKTQFSLETREKKKVIEPSEEKRTLMTVSKTIRGGQCVTYDGDLMIIGNVNPGAYVIATGNIIVLGALKGVAHAGAGGDEDAVVIALTLKPQQLKIANIVTRPPDDDVQTLYPEKAFVKDKTIQIEKI
ncbi:MAG: septum site-determining protein MinC [Candidatus Magnetobacterium sp. LHC-1]